MKNTRRNIALIFGLVIELLYSSQVYAVEYDYNGDTVTARFHYLSDYDIVSGVDVNESFGREIHIDHFSTCGGSYDCMQQAMANGGCVLSSLGQELAGPGEISAALRYTATDIERLDEEPPFFRNFHLFDVFFKYTLNLENGGTREQVLKKSVWANDLDLKFGRWRDGFYEAVRTNASPRDINFEAVIEELDGAKDIQVAICRNTTQSLTLMSLKVVKKNNQVED